MEQVRSPVLEQAVNRIEVKGSVFKIEKGQTKNGLDFYNILIEVKGKKYTDIVPFVAYGEYRIPQIGTEVVIFGRIRSKVFDAKYSPTLIIESILPIVQDIR